MNLVACFLTFLLFIGPVVLAVIGWPITGFSEKTTLLYPSFYILCIIVLRSFLKRDLIEKKFKYALWIVFVSFSAFVLNRLFGRETSKNVLFQAMALPAMYYVMYSLLENKYEIKIKIRNIIIVMFLANALIAIYERMTLTLYFPYDLISSDFDFEFQEESIFRSSALLGHPLTFAFEMFIVMVFVLISNINYKHKILLYFIGFVSVFCANARAAIMFAAGIFFLYSIRPLFQKEVSTSKRFSSVALLILFVFIGIYLFDAGLGGRFEERGDFSEDGSTLARIEVWSIFSRYGLSNFLWGLPYSDVEKMAISVLGMTHIENWFILSTMIVGLIVTGIVTLLFVVVYRQATKAYDFFSSSLIFLGVIGLGSTNNSFATGIPALSIFFACCYAFSPIVIDEQSEVREVEEHELGTESKS